jgi:hypothetical protein
MEEGLQIHGQCHEHDDVWIAGDAITKALEQGSAVSSGFASDGEGFYTIIVKAQSEEMDNLQLPYPDAPNTGKHPHDLLPMGQYTKLINGERQERNIQVVVPQQLP